MSSRRKLLARSSRAICLAVPPARVIKFPLSPGADTSFDFTWGAFIARSILKTIGAAGKVSRQALRLLYKHLLRNPDARLHNSTTNTSPATRKILQLLSPKFPLNGPTQKTTILYIHPNGPSF